MSSLCAIRWLAEHKSRPDIPPQRERKSFYVYQATIKKHVKKTNKLQRRTQRRRRRERGKRKKEEGWRGSEVTAEVREEEGGVAYQRWCTRHCGSHWCEPGRSHLCFGKPAAASQLSLCLCSHSTTWKKEQSGERREGEREGRREGGKRRKEGGREGERGEKEGRRERREKEMNRWWDV